MASSREPQVPRLANKQPLATSENFAALEDVGNFDTFMEEVLMDLSGRSFADGVSIISPGHMHTVGLKSDGTVVVLGGTVTEAGDSGYDRLISDLGDWTDIRQPDAPAYILIAAQNHIG